MPLVGSIAGSLVGSIVGPDTSTGESLLDGLVAWWSLDEASGTRVNAHNPGTYDLTDNNTVLSDTGVVGDAATFVAASDESLGDVVAADLQFSTGDFSVTGWARFTNDSETAGHIVGAANDGGSGLGWRVCRLGTNQQIQMRVRNAADSASVNSSGINITYDTWFFFEAGFDGTAEEFFLAVNRGTRVTTALAGGRGGSNKAFYIGGMAAGNSLHGMVDNVTIHPGRLLTTEELDALYNSGAGMAYPG